MRRLSNFVQALARRVGRWGDSYYPEYYHDVARKVASETPGSFLANQFSNPANPFAHRTTTAPEIWDQMEGDKAGLPVCRRGPPAGAAARDGHDDAMMRRSRDACR